MGDSKTLFDRPLRGALRDRAACDAIRSLHLRCEKRSLLTSIPSTLTPNDEEVRSSRIESITLRRVCVCVNSIHFKTRGCLQVLCSLPLPQIVVPWPLHRSYDFILGRPRITHHGSNHPISHNKRCLTCSDHTSITLDSRLESSPSEPYSLQAHDSS